jgi:hypothetical protein
VLLLGHVETWSLSMGEDLGRISALPTSQEIQPLGPFLVVHGRSTTVEHTRAVRSHLQRWLSSPLQRDGVICGITGHPLQGGVRGTGGTREPAGMSTSGCERSGEGVGKGNGPRTHRPDRRLKISSALPSASPGRKKDYKWSADAKQIAVDTGRRCTGDYTAALEVLEINHPSTCAVPHHELQFCYLKRWTEQGISDERSSNRSGLEVAGKVGCVLPSGLIARSAPN